MSSYYRKQLEDWLSKLEVHAHRVWDVGGSQLPVKDRVRKWDVAEYKIFDLPSPHVKKAPVDFELDLNKGPNYGFDPKAGVVFCLEVMEYIYNPLTALSTLRDMLVEGGTLYITFPYYYPPHEPKESDVLRYTLSGSKKLLELSGFRVEEVFYRDAKSHGFYVLNTENALRTSKTANYQEVNSLGFIIKAKAVGVSPN